MAIKKELFISGLDRMIANPKCELKYDTPFQLLVAVILSAQCTDKRVNAVTAELFKTHSKPEDFVKILQEELEQKIHACGFFHNKAKAIKDASAKILQDFGGQVPSDFGQLLSLPGVGRKTANVMLAEAFGQDAFAVDTHVLRVSNRMGFVKTDNPDRCEEKLKQIFPKKMWSRLHYQMVLFGRYTCKAIKPDCENCALNANCPSCRIGLKSEK